MRPVSDLVERPLSWLWPGRLGEGELAEVEVEDVVGEEGQGGMGFFQAGEGVLLGLSDGLRGTGARRRGRGREDGACRGRR